MANYTSEDNASFSALMEKEEETHQAKYWWVYDKLKVGAWAVS
jgi:hypothetical protein